MKKNYWEILDKYLEGDKKKNRLSVAVLAPPSRTYTGAGPDGVVQPWKPAGVDHTTNPPSVYHEDEVVTKSANGQLIGVQPSPYTAAKSEAEQAEIARQQNLNSWPGYQTGFDATTQNRDSLPAFGIGYGEGVAQMGGGQHLGSGLSPEAQQRKFAATPQPPQTSVGMRPAGFQSTPPPPQAPQQTPYEATRQMRPAGFQSTPPPPQAPLVAIDDARRAREGSPLAAIDEARRAREAAYPATPTAPPPAPTDAAQPRPKSIWDVGMTEGYGGIRDIARGQSEASRMAREQTMDYLTGTQAGQLGTMQQQWLSGGVAPGTMAALSQQAGRSADITRGDVAGKLALSEAERAEAAQRDLVTYGAKMQDSEDQAYALETLKRTTEGSRLAAMLQGYADAGIDYTQDPAAMQAVSQAAQAAWQANGFAGPVDNAWIAAQNKVVNVNPLDAAWRSTESSDWFAALPSDKQADLREAYPIFSSLVSTGGVHLKRDEEGNLVMEDSEGNMLYPPSGKEEDAPADEAPPTMVEISDAALSLSGYLNEYVSGSDVENFNTFFGRSMSGDNDKEYRDAFAKWFKESSVDTALEEYMAGESSVLPTNSADIINRVRNVPEYRGEVDGTGVNLSTHAIVEKFINGELSDGQAGFLMRATGTEDVPSAIDKILEGTGVTLADFRKVMGATNSAPVELTVGKNTTSPDVSKWYPDGRGKMHFTVDYPDKIYDLETYDDPDEYGKGDIPRRLSFNSATLDWINENKGKKIVINGAEYYLDAKKPMVKDATSKQIDYAYLSTEGEHMLRREVYLDALNLIEVNTGHKILWVPEVTGKIWDKSSEGVQPDQLGVRYTPVSMG